MNTQMTIEYLVLLLAILAVTIGPVALYRATGPTSQTRKRSIIPRKCHAETKSLNQQLNEPADSAQVPLIK